MKEMVMLSIDLFFNQGLNLGTFSSNCHPFCQETMFARMTFDRHCAAALNIQLVLVLKKECCHY